MQKQQNPGGGGGGGGRGRGSFGNGRGDWYSPVPYLWLPRPGYLAGVSGVLDMKVFLFVQLN